MVCEEVTRLKSCLCVSAALQNFDAVPDSQLVFDAQDSILLRSETVDLPLENQLRKCVIGECVCVCVILRVCVFVCVCV